MQLSVVIPLLNEKESLQELYDWLIRVISKEGYTYELLFVDDGSTDGSWQKIEVLALHNPNVKGICFNRNYGKSQALNAGFLAVEGDVVITMDADLQDSPDEIPELYRLISEEGYDIVSGWKKKRYDAVLTKNLPSKLFNAAARKTSGLQLHDFNCGLKAYRNEVVKNIDVYGDMHRYIPLLAKNAGFINITEKPVQHQARKYGQTKFGADRFIKGFLDLLTIWFTTHFAKRPMHLFGTLGAIMFIIGFGLAAYLGIDKLFINPTARLLTQRPQFYLALTSMIIGMQLFIAGFLGELVQRTKHERPRYLIKDKKGFN
ncbi:glycosyltransferase family 2 protein [Leeuwenhoekiella palythoae]|uniref:Glycosyltransferase involved in cell wall biosynthesis n=1 Tax=Leeuwenhoekiella palythoae TaxID=573501 RepID=A0A1M5Y0J9_9FLAO|nr:glycosyltransferase family 2 protein [Leeuwenhoekiella palythoae]MBH14365.1 glycosyltransferase [Leeuwenhoekiella sp.]RXG30390.1 glycosyltransferase involved in cell wall biosynthesis [Leeuwenhoekiella palythoae]SHI05522.1 Glycosyltransferase involved in cell wall bisynthesis [Leeuwenhoekiella palythoae]|tara:strand:- start:174 stop:1124 length:951 start_codon:yes stop_codon:yes gene_type:complete